MSGFLIRVWCRDCSGDNDEYGCFGGSTELRGRDGCEAQEPFATLDEAKAYGHKFTMGPPWEYEVTDLSGKEVGPEEGVRG
jgi:hypothetical protein